MGSSLLLAAAATAFLLTLLMGVPGVKWLRHLKAGQVIREEGPQSHLHKAGTPSMGGSLILLALATTTLLLTPTYTYLPYLLVVTLGYGLLGLVDDFIIVVRKRSLGLSARHKLAGQILIALVLALFVAGRPELGTSLTVPGLGWEIKLGTWAYVAFAVFLLVGTSNAVNLTDGLDGLAAGTVAVAALAYTGVALLTRQEELAIFAVAVTGACLGFAWFNAHPAQVFMGDTGSLALGGALGGLALLTKTELFLPIIGGIFVAETLSVIIQVVTFKLTGKRVFRMSPLHHHFELSGWVEPKVVARFLLIEALLAVLGLLLVLETLA